jgi:hypothetical protein
MQEKALAREPVQVFESVFPNSSSTNTVLPRISQLPQGLAAGLNAARIRFAALSIISLIYSAQVVIIQN